MGTARLLPDWLPGGHLVDRCGQQAGARGSLSSSSPGSPGLLSVALGGTQGPGQVAVPSVPQMSAIEAQDKVV